MKASFWYLWNTFPGCLMVTWLYSAQLKMRYDWDLPLHWRPYVTGDITEYPVDCQHLEMLSPESIMVYGKQLKLLLEP